MQMSAAVNVRKKKIIMKGMYNKFSIKIIRKNVIPEGAWLFLGKLLWSSEESPSFFMDKSGGVAL